MGKERKVYSNCDVDGVLKEEIGELLSYINNSAVMYGRPPLGKGFLVFRQTCRGAVMYAAFDCGR
jgi:hypothetical protein